MTVEIVTSRIRLDDEEARDDEIWSWFGKVFRMYAIKTEITDTEPETFTFNFQKTMYGGKHISEGDKIFLFASENEGGWGLIAKGVVTYANLNREETWGRKADPSGKHHHSAHHTCKAKPGTKS